MNVLALELTRQFVEAHVPHGNSVLEVGCGDGALALALQQAGLRVVAIDRDDAVIARARERGAAARCCDFLDERVELPVSDAVLFARSLHHLHDVGAALDRAGRLLASGGTLLVDDFDWEFVDAATASWARALDDVCEPMVGGERFVARQSPHEQWLDRHRAEHLHGGDRMLAATRARFDVTVVERGPYFFRYVEAAGAPAHLVRAIHELEQAAIAKRTIRPLGLRWAARKRDR